MVPREVIDEIRERVDIIRLIGDVLPLKKTGRNFVGLCPFHQEKSPSFTVSEQKQLYHCFGCGEGGTALTFVMNYHHLTFPETLERLAPMAGIDLTQYQGESEKVRERKELQARCRKILAYARDIYHAAFLKSPSAELARTYARSRGIGPEMAKSIKLGFAPDSWTSLVSAIERDKQSFEDAWKAGLLTKRHSDGSFVDVFRSRLLFPITDPQGGVVGFGGRILGDGQPKYLNSPETPVFEKGKLLYGLHEAEKSIRETKKMILVEGYMDQVALAEAGLKNTVATLGTALTDAHARIVRQYADELILLFDGDAAGLKAARRSARSLLSNGIRTRVALLPQGEDPDTFVRSKGLKALEDLLSSASPLLDFYVERFYRSVSDVTDKANAIEELAQTIKETDSVFLKEALIDEVSKKSGVEPAILRGQAKLSFKVAPVPVKVSIKKATLVSQEVWPLLRLAAEEPSARERILDQETLNLFGDPSLSESVRNWIDWLEREGISQQTAPAAVDAWEDEATRPMLARAFLEGPMEGNISWDRVWDDGVRKLRRREIGRLSQAVTEAERMGSEETVFSLMRRMEQLKRLDEANTGGQHERR